MLPIAHNASCINRRGGNMYQPTQGAELMQQAGHNQMGRCGYLAASASSATITRVRSPTALPPRCLAVSTAPLSPEFGSADALRDLWHYTPRGNTWDWDGATPSAGTSGRYTGSNVVPGSRFRAVSWVGANDVKYLFGGIGCGRQGVPCGQLNDLWTLSR